MNDKNSIFDILCILCIFILIFTLSTTPLQREAEAWCLVARMAIYNPDKSKLPTQNYESEPARAIQMCHDCWRFLLDLSIANTENTHSVLYGHQSRHQTGSFVVGFLGDQQVRNMQNRQNNMYTQYAKPFLFSCAFF